MEKKKTILKKWWFWVLAVVLVGGMVGACGGQDDKEKEGKKKEVSDEKNTEGKEKEKKEEEEEEKTKEAAVEEQVLLEQDGIKVTLKELDNDSLLGPQLKVLVENSSEKNLTVQTNNVSVNGIMIQSLFSCEVAAGKSANNEISLLSSDLEDAGITIIQNVELNFHVFDTASYDTVFDSDTIYIATSLDGTEEQAIDDSGVVLLEQDGIKLTVKEADSENSFWGADIYIYVENSTDKNITVQASAVSINGFMVQPYFSCEVVAGKKAYDSITFMESDLKDNNIESIDNMDISFHVFDTASYDTVFDTDPLSVSFAE